MNKQELITAIAAETGETKVKTQLFVENFCRVIGMELALGGEVTLVNFGKFSTSARKPRMGRNPQTGEAIEIPASKAVRFSPGKELRARLNEE